MENYKTQPATASDGISKELPKGQTNKMEHLNNPKPMSGLAETRHTGKIASGTSALRAAQSGSNN